MTALPDYRAIAQSRVHGYGAPLLDDVAPAGWASRIDPDHLYIGSDVAGVLGQVYGSYWRGLDALWPNVADDETQHRLGVEHGFHWDRGHSLDPDGECEALKEAWLQAIAERMIGAAA